MESLTYSDSPYLTIGRIIMTALCLLTLSIQFEQVAYFPYGTPGEYIYASDCDHDGNDEFFCTPGTATYYFEHISANQYEITEVFGFVTLAVGDGDADMLTDAFGMILHPGHIAETLAVYESMDYNAFPDTRVWVCEDTIAQYVANGGFADFDQDGLMNLITDAGRDLIYIFENSGDNAYIRKFRYVFSNLISEVKFTVSDFDLDGLLEIAWGDGEGNVYLFENVAIGIDSFETVWTHQLPSVNAYLTARGNDMDGDGKPELIAGGNSYFGWCFTIFETNGNNSYEQTWQYIYPGGSLTYGDVDCGDVDGDGREEMVTFGGMILSVWKCVGPDSFVQFWQHDFHYDLVDGRLLVHDLNQNGYDEIVISGFNYYSTPPLKTYIYEYVPQGIIEDTQSMLQETRLEVFPDPFRDATMIYCRERSAKDFELRIYDVNGRLIKQFGNPTVRLSDRIVWYGEDNSGRKLPAGIYFVQLKNRNLSIIKKIVKMD
jgi:hypothetical protein